MKLTIALDNYAALQQYIWQAKQEYGPEFQRIIVSNEIRLKIMANENVDIQQQPVDGISVITEPFLPADEVQVVLGQGAPE